VQLTASHGVGQVLADPSRTLIESVEAIAMAELTDNECWETRAGLVRLGGREDLAERCDAALATEEEHLDTVRTWLAAGQGRPVVEGDADDEDEVEE